MRHKITGILIALILLTACTGMNGNTTDMAGRYKCESDQDQLSFIVTIGELTDKNAITFKAKAMNDSLLILTKSGSSYRIGKQDVAAAFGETDAMALDWRSSGKGSFRLSGDDRELATCHIMDDKNYNPAGEYQCQIVGGDNVEGEISRLGSDGFGFTAPFTNHAIIPLTRIEQGFRSNDGSPVSLYMQDPFNEGSFLIVVQGKPDASSDVVWCHKK